MIVLTFTPMVSISCSMKSWCTSVNGLNEAASITPRTCPSKTMGKTMRLTGAPWPSPEEIFT